MPWHSRRTGTLCIFSISKWVRRCAEPRVTRLDDGVARGVQNSLVTATTTKVHTGIVVGARFQTLDPRIGSTPQRLPYAVSCGHASRPSRPVPRNASRGSIATDEEIHKWHT